MKGFHVSLKEIIVFIILLIFLVLVCARNYQLRKENERSLAHITEVIKQGDKLDIIYRDQTIESLKTTNKHLYDSIAAYKNEIAYLLKFKYQKNFRVDTVFINEEPSELPIQEFAYEGEPNDTLQYRLTIGAHEEPNWYTMDVSVKDSFTIINKKYNDYNHLTIDNGGEISDVIVVNTPTKKSIWNKFAIGPSVNVGYNPFDNRVDCTIGFSITYNLLGK